MEELFLNQVMYNSQTEPSCVRPWQRSQVRVDLLFCPEDQMRPRIRPQ